MFCFFWIIQIQIHPAPQLAWHSAEHVRKLPRQENIGPVRVIIHHLSNQFGLSDFLLSFFLHLDLGPDPLVRIIDADLGKKLEKPNLEGDRRFSRDGLGDDDRRCARYKPPGEALGKAPDMGVFSGACAGDHDSIGSVVTAACWRLSRPHGRIGRRRDLFEAALACLEVVLVRRLPRGSSFSGFHYEIPRVTERIESIESGFESDLESNRLKSIISVCRDGQCRSRKQE